MKKDFQVLKNKKQQQYEGPEKKKKKENKTITETNFYNNKTKQNKTVHQ
ncbi:hypothetical protein DOY81_001667 [Sarcophaga bullata]|nr:hypothetical protein DOY81_001667 [Sarcophaga bullata]